MEEQDWDNPEVESSWCSERRRAVADYLAREGLEHGQIGDWPAWHIAPYVSVWAIESLLAPGFVGWWAISGDLPNDYISATEAKHPRTAVLEFADAWQRAASRMAAGLPPENFIYRDNYPEQADLLERYSQALRRLAADDSLWEDD